MSLLVSLADYIRLQRPYAFCASCLAQKMHLSEHDVREKLQVIAFQPGFGCRLRACYGCAQTVELVEAAPGA